MTGSTNGTLCMFKVDSMGRSAIVSQNKLHTSSIDKVRFPPLKLIFRLPQASWVSAFFFSKIARTIINSECLPDIKCTICQNNVGLDT